MYGSPNITEARATILRRIFGPKRDENEEWRIYTMRKSIACTFHVNL
jgi:hypothetical protein